MSQAALLGSTLERLYAAAIDGGLWRDALVAVEQFTGSTGAVVDLIPLEASTRPVTLAGSFSDQDCREYAENYQSICPRIAYAVKHPEVAIHFDRLVLTEAEMDRDPVYEWFGKHGLRYYVAGHTGRTQFYQAFASLQRSHRQGHADADDIARFELIRPHLAQALNIADTLGTLATHQRLTHALLDAMPQAVFGLANDGALLFTNDSAERLVARGGCLTLRGKHLVTAHPQQQAELDKIIASAVSPESFSIGGWLLLRRSDGGQPYPTRVSRISTLETEVLIRPTVLVIVNDPAIAADADPGLLRELYGLTTCEARVASALLHGHSLQSAARCYGISVETMRSQLKSIFRKVGVSRQQDLVRVLAELESSAIASCLAHPA